MTLIVLSRPSWLSPSRSQMDGQSYKTDRIHVVQIVTSDKDPLCLAGCALNRTVRTFEGMVLSLAELRDRL